MCSKTGFWFAFVTYLVLFFFNFPFHNRYLRLYFSYIFNKWFPVGVSSVLSTSTTHYHSHAAAFFCLVLQSLVFNKLLLLLATICIHIILHIKSYTTDSVSDIHDVFNSIFAFCALRVNSLLCVSFFYSSNFCIFLYFFLSNHLLLPRSYLNFPWMRLCVFVFFFFSLKHTLFNPKNTINL